MEYQLSQDEIKIKRAFIELCERQLKPSAENVDEQEEIPESHWRALADFGYLGFGFDPEFGGGGHPLALWICLAEQLARCCASTYAAVNASSHLFGCFVQMFGTAEQKKKYLPALAAGKLKAAVALTDTKSLSEENSGLTIAEPALNGYAISGIKPYVINGPICDVALVSASENPEPNAMNKKMFFIEPGKEGFIRGERQSTLGVRGAQIGSLRFGHCPVTQEDILGRQNDPKKTQAAFHTLQCLWWAIYGIGIGQACIDASIEYAGSRKIFGKSISKHQEVHFKIAEMHMYTDTSRLLAYKAAWQLDQKLPDNGVAPSAKVLATEMSTRCSHQALQIFGGKGYLQGSPVERFYRDARLGELIGETSEVLRVELAQGVLEQFKQ